MNFWTYFLFLQLLSYLFALIYKVAYVFYKLRPFLKFILKISSYVHETAHYLMAKLMGVQVRFRDVNYQKGYMIVRNTPKNQERGAFLKNLFIAFAPCLLSTIGIIRMIEYFPVLNTWQGYLIWGSLMISLFWAVGISKADLMMVVRKIQDYPRKSSRQILEIVLAWGIYLIWFDLFVPLLPSLGYLFEFAMIVGLVIVLEIFQSIIKHGWKYIFKPRQRTGTSQDFTPHITRKMNRQYAKIFFSKPTTLIDNPEDLP
ncbi:MAG: hypothetical protein ACTSRK_20600 [Promethearchaeota archaeon]